MKTTGLLLITCLISLQVYCQEFTQMLEKLAMTPGSQKQLQLDSYFREHPQVPVIEKDNSVYFIYKGNAASVAVAGDATAWTPSLMMERIPSTDYWYCRARYESDARLEYKIVVDGTLWKLDSLNSDVIQGGMGPNSELLMPGYIRPIYVNERDVVPWGFYTDTVLNSKIMGEARKIRIYTPPHYEKSNERYPVAYFHDGFQFFDFTAARNVMDNMTFEKKIRPMIAVFVEPVNRDEEYSGKLQDKYTRFMVEELIPYIAGNYRTVDKPENVAQIGISNGGNIALWIAANHPEKIGKAAAFSSNVQPAVKKAFSAKHCTNQKIYLDLGKYDLPVLVPLVRGLKVQLEEKGCPLSYHEYPEGHNWAFWQKHLPDALEYFFPAE